MEGQVQAITASSTRHPPHQHTAAPTHAPREHHTNAESERRLANMRMHAGDCVAELTLHAGLSRTGRVTTTRTYRCCRRVW